MRLTNVSSKPHAHKCSCGYTWAHSPEELIAKCESLFDYALTHDRAHTCPSCGTQIWNVLQADKAENCTLWDGKGFPVEPKDRKISKVG